MHPLQGKYILKKDLLMGHIVSRVYKLLKEINHLIEPEEHVQLLLYGILLIF